MKISLDWLREFVPVNVPPKQLAHDLTMVGLAVESFEEVAGDIVFDLDLTTNRPDCYNHLGVAREIATLYGLDVVPQKPFKNHKKTSGQFGVEIKDPALCPRYSSRLMADVKVAPSPEWMQKRLLAVGQRPINNIVDITNYVLLEMGHPMHAFDFKELKGGKIVVRRAAPDESLVTLDGQLRPLDSDMLVIADASRPVALAGIMGGLETEVSPQTDALLLESAYFLPLSVRRTAKRLGLRTEASYRFERGADPEATTRALDRACQLIEQIGCGRVHSELVDEYPQKMPRGKILLRLSNLQRLLGTRVEKDFIAQKLTSLQFQVKTLEADLWEVAPPSFRVDVSLEADLIEEVARHFGYHAAPSRFPPWQGKGDFLPFQSHEDRLRQALFATGYTETVTYVFSHPAEEELFRPDGSRPAKVQNPLSEESTLLRTSLVAGLLNTLRWNFNRGTRNLKIFELGRLFSCTREGEVTERKALGLSASGEEREKSWMETAQPVSLYSLKGVLESVAARLGLQRLRLQATSSFSFLHPGEAAVITAEGMSLGMCGRLHPRILEVYKFKQEVYVAQLDLEALFARPLPEARHQRIARFPAIFRDLSFLIDRSVAYGQLEEAIRSLEIRELAEIRLFDLYRGEMVPPDKISLAIRLKYLDPERTLTDEEVKAHQDRVVSLLESQFAARLR
ncbi:MAG: phenylalanine--tRNA ligase subunit beta [Acidobacteria bacterium]|nr:phenylalanine--tRNA ligase subunit beta [Acidobacteriota bacterium]